MGVNNDVRYKDKKVEITIPEIFSTVETFYILQLIV